MRTTRWVVVGLAVWMTLPAASVAVEQYAAVPAKLHGKHTLVVRGSIGRLERLNFVIDTGAVPTVVDEHIARKLTLSGEDEPLWLFSRTVQAHRVVLPRVRVGPIDAPSLPALVQDLSFIERDLGVRIDALIGLDLLAPRTFCLDYESKELVFGPARLKGSSATIEPGLAYAVVHLDVQGQPLRLLVDTGGKNIVLFDRAIRGRLPGLRVVGEKVSQNVGGQFRVRQVKLPAARLGDITLYNLGAYVLNSSGVEGMELDGLLGPTALGARRFQFDFAGNIVRWQ